MPKGTLHSPFPLPVTQSWYPGTATPTVTSNTVSTSSAPTSGKKPTLKEKWKKLKEEDKKRKEQKITYITEEDATKITGYGKDGGPKTRDEEKNGYKKTGTWKVIHTFLGL
jgi:hypothetical protein